MAFFGDNVAPPDGYVCKLCFVPGHFMKHCSLYKDRLGTQDNRQRYDPHAVPPDNYVCKLCFVPGHFMKNCTLYKERAPGILSTATPTQLEELAKAVVAAAQAQTNGDVATSAMAALAAYRAQHPELSRAVGLDEVERKSPESDKSNRVDAVVCKHENGSINGGEKEEEKTLEQPVPIVPKDEHRPEVQVATMTALATLESLQQQQQAFWAQHSERSLDSSGLSQLAGALQHLSMRNSPGPYQRKHFSASPPDGYVCKICGVPGHWIQQCPLRHTHPPPHLRQVSPVSPVGQGFNGVPQRSPPLQYNGHVGPSLLSPTSSMSSSNSLNGVPHTPISPTFMSYRQSLDGYPSQRSTFDVFAPFEPTNDEAEKIVERLLM